MFSFHMAENTIQVDGVIRVSANSDSNGSTAESTLPLTLFDTFWLKFPPVERLFFYELTHLTHPLFDSVILPNLKRSLSLTLLHYPPLAGQIKWPPQAPKPAVFYSPKDGVSVTVAESNANFDRVSADDIHEALELRPLTPELVTSDDFADMVALQITLFPNKGFSIGVSTHHAIFDGKSSTTFIKSWAHLCKSLIDEDQQSPSLPPELTPSFDRTVIKDPTGADVSFVEKWFGLDGKYSSNSRSLKVFPTFGAIQNSVRGTFELSREDLTKLRNRVEEYYQVKESKHKLHLSTFVLTCAYVFVCMVKARGGDKDRQVVIGFAADYRTRLEPPITSNYFGNCVGTQASFLKAEDLMEEKGVEIAAEKLSEAIKGLENKGAVEALEQIFGLYGKVEQGIQILGTAGSNRFGVYETDFGWGRPKKVEIVSIDRTGSVSLAESRRAHGGVEVGLVLDKNEMDAFASFFYQVASWAETIKNQSPVCAVDSWAEASKNQRKVHFCSPKSVSITSRI